MFIDAERRFKQLEQETKKLHEDSKKYQDSIMGISQSHDDWINDDRNDDASNWILKGHSRNL